MAHSKRNPLPRLLELVIRERDRLIDAVEQHSATAVPPSIVGPDGMGELVDTGEVGKLLARFRPRDGRGEFETFYDAAVRMLNESPNGSHWLPKLERLRTCHQRLYHRAQRLAEERKRGLFGWSIKHHAPALNELTSVATAFRSRRAASEKSVRRTVKRRRPTTEPKHLTDRQCEVLEVVAQCDGNFTKAGKRLGIHRKTVAEHYHTALRKTGRTATKPQTRRLPTDRRGQALESSDRRLGGGSGGC